MADQRTFSRSVQVRFGDCDPAGIVFYPRYFEMFNNLVEDWCPAGLGTSFQELIQVRELGLPAVSISTDFVATSKLGDELRAERVRATLVLVLMDLKKACATPIPDAMRARIAQFGPAE